MAGPNPEGVTFEATVFSVETMPDGVKVLHFQSLPGEPDRIASLQTPDAEYFKVGDHASLSFTVIDKSGAAGGS